MPNAKKKEGSGRGKARNGNHVETRCKWDDKKIARGMEFCNSVCRKSYSRFKWAAADNDRKGE